MSILDKLRGRASKAREQADHVVEQHGDKIATGIEKTGEVASKVTGHRFDEKIDKGVHRAKERFENNNGEGSGAAGSDATGPDAPPEHRAEASDEPTTEPGTGTDSPPDRGPTA